MRQNSFKPINGDRPEAPNIVILLTDGKSNGVNPVEDEAEKLRQKLVKIICVGIGKLLRLFFWINNMII